MARLPTSVFELMDQEKIYQLIRMGYGPMSLAERIIPANLKMSEPRQPYCVIIDKKTGELRSSCTPQRASEYYANRDDVIIQHKKPHPYYVGLWRWNEAIRDQLQSIWTERFEQNLIDYKATEDLSGVHKCIALAIGSERWRVLDRGEALSYAQGFGGRGHEFLTDNGRVFVDLGVERGTIYMSQIAVETKGSGLGTKIMEALKDYASENRLDICIYKITNREFYERFEWLNPVRGGDFVAKSADLRVNQEMAPIHPR